MSPALAVYVKECRESLRDKRVLLNALILGPLLGPLLFVGLLRFAIGHELEQADRPLPVVIIGAERAPNLVAALEQQGLQALPALGDVDRAVREQRVSLALRIDDHFAEDWRAGRPAQVDIIYDSSQREGGSRFERLLQMGDRTAIPSYNYENMRITAYDMPPIVRAAWLRAVVTVQHACARIVAEAAGATRVPPI